MCDPLQQAIDTLSIKYYQVTTELKPGHHKINIGQTQRLPLQDLCGLPSYLGLPCVLHLNFVPMIWSKSTGKNATISEWSKTEEDELPLRDKGPHLNE